MNIDFSSCYDGGIIMTRNEGMFYAPKSVPSKVVAPGEFAFSTVALDHGHAYAMTQALMDAGATIKYVYDPDSGKVEAFLKAFPDAKKAKSEEEVFSDPETTLIVSAAIPSDRAALGIRAMKAGKDYFTDKPALTTLEQLEDVKKAISETGRKYMCYYSERLHSEAGTFVSQLIKEGAIGKVLQLNGLGPHRMHPETRPDWFFDKKKCGGILVDLGCHQIEQYLYYAGEEDAEVTMSRVANYEHKEMGTFDDFGDCAITGKNGSTLYFRVDWFTPEGLRAWGDGRTFILGTDGYIETRKYIDVTAPEKTENTVILVNREGEKRFNVTGQVGFPFFGEMILDMMNRTENAMTQKHVLKAAELAVIAEKNAKNLS